MEGWIAALPPTVQDPVVKFADPHPPGGRARARLAGRALVEFARVWPAGQAGLRQALDDLCGHLNTVGQTTLHQPGVVNLMRFVLADGVADDAKDAAQTIARRFQEADTTMTTAIKKIAEIGDSLLADGDTVLIHDFAETRQAIVALAARNGKHLTVIAPACRTRRAHGIRVAREARAVGHDALVVTDAGLGWVVARGGIKAAFLGADAFLPDGTLLATPGSLAIATIGSRYGLSVYCPTDLWKLAPALDPRLEALNEAPDPDGVPEANEWVAEGLRYLNPLVDVVPGDFLTGLVTEAGIIKPRDAGREAARLYGSGPEVPALSAS
jgi:translation initiation factor 2B subunit (eIF-2B alpha/beta/delta family)